jgi:hypothetical protein
MKNRATASQNFVLLTLLILLSGCLGDPENDSPMEGLEATIIQDFDFSVSYQFNDSLPMGHGQHMTFETNSSDAKVSLKLMTRFHQPDHWMNGSINLTIAGPENYSWSYTTNETKYQHFNITLPLAGNYTVVALSDGSDDPYDDIPGDAYVALFEVVCYGS